MLVNLTLNEFLNKVAGSDPVPGGGSIAALSGSISAALTAMVAHLTIGKKKYAEYEEKMQYIATEAEKIQRILVAYIDKDSDAYNRVFDCFKMPKETDEEKAERRKAIQEATKYAAEIPLEVAKKSFELLPLIEDVVRHGNQNAITDGCVAMMSVRTAVLGAILNVRINLGCLDDKEWALKIQEEVDALESATLEREKEITSFVSGGLRL